MSAASLSVFIRLRYNRNWAVCFSCGFRFPSGDLQCECIYAAVGTTVPDFKHKFRTKTGKTATLHQHVASKLKQSYLFALYFEYMHGATTYIKRKIELQSTQ
jgi:hypothetical protein